MRKVILSVMFNWQYSLHKCNKFVSAVCAAGANAVKVLITIITTQEERKWVRLLDNE